MIFVSLTHIFLARAFLLRRINVNFKRFQHAYDTRSVDFADEATSGNLLRRDPAKKAWCIYFTWVEMGTALISRVISWVYGGVIHLNKVKEVDGGFGTVFKHHMDYFFGQQCDLRNGITIHTADSEVLMLFSTG